MFGVAQSILRSSSAMVALQADRQSIGDYEESEIQTLFQGGKVLITGATGFLGKVLMESLLRKTSTEKIFILIRSKRNKTTEERMKEMLNDKVFQKLKSENPARMSAINLISGDCSSPGLGLSNADKEMLLNEVNIIFHGAATVRFNENLKTATGTNVAASQMILDLARQMKNLRVVMHVSTAYSNSQFDEIVEKVYPVHEEFNLIQLANSIDKDTASKITKNVIGDSPNTYVFTKRITEDMIQRKYSDLPVGIFRPAIVIGAKEEPSPGYVDNLYGPTGLAIGIMSGVVHCLLIGTDANADLVPVDYTVNCLIASAWETYTRFVTDRPYTNIPVYNFVPYPKSPITWGQFTDQIVESGRKGAPDNSIWHSFIFRVKSLWLYRLITAIFHFLPAWIGDTIMKVLGKKPRWKNIYERTDEVMIVLRPFCTRSFRFSNENVQDLWRRLNKKDKQLFPFSLQNFDWRNYFDIYLQGVKIYMMKEKIDPKAAEQRSKRFRFFHYTLIFSMISFWSGIIFVINKFYLQFNKSV
ncbi:unnamed protein product [Nezara viridula]|uniref:Fatty acyl-CoA reductase n=1 Tax=Nezara viridula TaxID=85310 RepID=A0A9P0HIL2_NEZVI|nr:unnamed protein product [Nezara viridula]